MKRFLALLLAASATSAQLGFGATDLGTVQRVSVPASISSDESSLTWADVPPERIAQWRELAVSGKGVAVAKLRGEGRVQVVLFSGTNVVPWASRVASGATLRFDSAEELAAFLRAVGAGVRLSSGGLKDDAGIVEPFSEEERCLLRLDDPLEGERDQELPGTRRAARVDDPEFDWIKRGTLSWVSERGYLYLAADGRSMFVSGDPAKVAALVRAELYDVQRLDALVRERLPEVMLRLLGNRDAFILSRSYLERRVAVLGECGERPETVAADGELLAKHVAVEPLVQIDGRRWTLTMPVLNADGSVEQ